MVDIISLLSTDGYIICNKALIKLFGGDCAILVGELCAEHTYYNRRGELTNDGFFFSTQDNIESMTGLNPYAQRKALRVLQDNGIVDIERRGVPAQNYYRINENKLSEIFISRCVNFEHQEVQNLNTNNNTNKNNNNTNTKVLVQSTPPKKQSLYEKCVATIEEYTSDDKLRDALIEYLKVRLAIKDKPIRGLAQWKALLKKLDTLKGDKYKIVLTATSGGWASFYEVKEDYRSKNERVFSESYETMTNKKGDRSTLNGEEF